MDWDLGRLVAAMSALGATQILFKELAPNDNSKNQVYLGGSLDILNVIPMGSVRSETTDRGVPILKASLDFGWLRADGSFSPAPHAQLILYPQYPEVRFSGFLRGADDAPNAVMASRDSGRVMLLGITATGRVIGWAGKAGPLKAQIDGLADLVPVGAFRHLQFQADADAEGRLLARLAGIAREGWIEAQRLYANGAIGPCNGVNCGGYTLEARLGIIPNGRSEPDFEGWEVKGHGVSAFFRLGVGVLTLMTPEPSGGLYKTDGPAAFIRKYGYPDTFAPDRLNFSTPHRFGILNPKTGLTLAICGFDVVGGKITNPHGAIVLKTPEGMIAAEWSFAKLLEHWNRKHERAAYVPYAAKPGAPPSYQYGDRVRLGRGTDFVRFLTAIASGAIWHDPGLKLEGATGPSPRAKCRNQFRMRSANLAQLYRHFEETLLF